MILSLDVVTRLLADPNAVSAFPFLARLKSDLDCQTCNGKRRRILSNQYKEIRKQVAQLGPDDRQRLKSLLNVETVEVSYVDERRKTRTVTF